MQSVSLELGEDEQPLALLAAAAAHSLQEVRLDYNSIAGLVSFMQTCVHFVSLSDLARAA